MNVAADSFTRAHIAAIKPQSQLEQIHTHLCHPGIARLFHYVRAKNLPYSMEDVKRVCADCRACAELKPRFHKPDNLPLIKATQPMERLSIDFKGPLPSSSKNKYILTIIDEYSRFPFAYPVQNMTSATVITCLNDLFTLCGTPAYIHSDRGQSFMSNELKDYLLERSVASSRSTPYNPEGNGQCERYNGIIWKSVQLALKTHNLPIESWEVVLPDALHSLRSLLCTATNTTPHERFFLYQRRSTSGTTLPSWLTPQGKAMLRRHVRASKHDPLVDEVEIIEVNPNYAVVRFTNGRESSVSLKDLSPHVEVTHDVIPTTPDLSDTPNKREVPQVVVQNASETRQISRPEEESNQATPEVNDNPEHVPLRRSTRTSNPPDRFQSKW